MSALIAVAHGSRDGRSAATVTALIELVRAQRPELDVRLAFLEFNAPRLPDVLAAVASDGHRRAVVVPLLLGSAYHARVDVPAAVDAVRGRLPGLDVLVGDVLGPDPRIVGTALHRLVDAGSLPGEPGLGVVLTAAGCSRPGDNATVHAVAASWPHTVAAFAAATDPDVVTAIAELRAAGARRVAVAPWFLAPGRLLDRVTAAARDADPTVVVADPLGPHPAVADVVLDRYDSASFTQDRNEWNTTAVQPALAFHSA
jgi:sirohydrochlorin ferrochelatase